MNIRPAAPDDAPAIAHVHVDSWRTTYAGIVPDDVLANLSVERREQSWRAAIITGEPGFVFVAEDHDGEIVGFASGGPERELHTHYSGELYAIYLLQQQQRLGVGRQLTIAVVNELLARGYRSMLVWVLADNPSRKFYESLGGQYVTEKTVAFGTASLIEVAYGWKDIQSLFVIPSVVKGNRS